MKLLLIMALLLCSSNVAAKTVGSASSGSIVVGLTDEPCALKNLSNLPYRATWTQPGKTFEGCYSIFAPGVVAAYFDDGSVAIIPFGDVKPAVEV